MSIPSGNLFHHIKYDTVNPHVKFRKDIFLQVLSYEFSMSKYKQMSEKLCFLRHTFTGIFFTYFHVQNLNINLFA